MIGRSCVVGGRGRRRWRRRVACRFSYRLIKRRAATSGPLINNHCAFEVLGLGASAGAGHRLNLLVVGREGVEQLLAKDGRLFSTDGWQCLAHWAGSQL